MRADKTTSFLISFVVLAMVGCGTLVGNPEEEDDKNPPPKQTASTDTGTDVELPDGTEVHIPPPLPTGKLKFSMTDAPLEEVAQVLVTVARIEVAKADGGWVEIPLVMPLEFDLASLQNGNSLPLASAAELPIGDYTQTRLILAETPAPRVVTKDGESEALKIPDGDKTGIKIATPFSLKEGEELALTIDFDLRKSLKRNGSGNGGRYTMKPVLRLVEDRGVGSIVGKAKGDAQVVCIYAAGAAKDETDECENAITSARVSDGKYRVAFIPTGKYDMRTFFKNSSTPVDKNGITVAAKEDADADDDEQ